jgi:hypothetical protein
VWRNLVRWVVVMVQPIRVFIYLFVNDKVIHGAILGWGEKVVPKFPKVLS